MLQSGITSAYECTRNESLSYLIKDSGDLAVDNILTVNPRTFVPILIMWH